MDWISCVGECYSQNAISTLTATRTPVLGVFYKPLGFLDDKSGRSSVWKNLCGRGLYKGVWWLLRGLANAIHTVVMQPHSGHTAHTMCTFHPLSPPFTPLAPTFTHGDWVMMTGSHVTSTFMTQQLWPARLCMTRLLGGLNTMLGWALISTSRMYHQISVK